MNFLPKKTVPVEQSVRDLQKKFFLNLEILLLTTVFLAAAGTYWLLHPRLDPQQLREILFFHLGLGIVSVGSLHFALQRFFHAALAQFRARNPVNRLLTMKRQAKSLLASQTIHDIRSPLAVLRLVTDCRSIQEEERRLLIQGAVNRIQTIMQNLSKKHSSTPQAAQVEPSAYLPSLSLEPHSTILVLDDDPCIHLVWDRKLGEVGLGKNGIEVRNFSSTEPFNQWIRAFAKGQKILCLVDYEIKGSPQNGLEVIESLGIADLSVLVTGRAEDLVEQCAKAGVRLIPKEKLPTLSISINAPHQNPSSPSAQSRKAQLAGQWGLG